MSHFSFLQKATGKIVRLVSRMLYGILSPSLCTRLASSRLGQAVARSITSDGNEAVYECDHGIRLRLSRPDAINMGIAQMGRANPLETRLALKYLQPGDTVVEVGVYKDGWLALVSSGVVGPAGRVFCFEPIPQYCREFRGNVELNGRQNITVEALAVAEAAGTATFSVSGLCSSMVFERDASTETIVVQTVTLDAYLQSKNIDSVDLMIIDSEGAESRILDGAQHILPHTTYLIVEVIESNCRQAGTTPDDLINKVCSFGFSPFIITRHGLAKWRPGRQSETMNVFFINEEAQHRRASQQRARG